MNKNGIFAALLAVSVVFSGCSTWSSATKGGLIGGGAGAAIGTGIGILVGKDAKSAAVGAAIGTAVGATTGVIIGKKMDKAAAEAAAIEGAQVQTITDANNLQAVKVTFDSGILFQTNKSVLNTASKSALDKFAKILIENPKMDIAIMGHTDNTGTLELNQTLSENRAKAVADYLKSKEVPAVQLKEIAGKNYSMPVADNATAEGRQQNRRVEVYMYASETMIKEAETESKN
jgi:outer membrane protein OmpA-like peptidoglycan-associated protein